ncbi:hypothetical protein [Nonomuraea sp. 10N515B]|uniref:hypothetical protein n=1 Tax=Nonomuraea sp. 10N515B TaxID=3457422 RepID=UPI003FCDE56B
MRSKRLLTHAIGILTTAVRALTILPSAPANAAYVYKYGKRGVFKSGVRGFLMLSHCHPPETETHDHRLNAPHGSQADHDKYRSKSHDIKSQPAHAAHRATGALVPG